MAKEIKMISLERIFPHPDNPRKDLGDLTELTESIRKNGIMQNLTVMTGHYDGKEWKDDGYTLLIGHRRAAAAKAAKLATVPCTVMTCLDRKEQVGIMLEENMQRADLTIREQAQGFQMMLDLGDTVEDVAKKTGFSQTTVRHRIAIAKLDPKAIQAAEQDGFYQISISDYMKLEQLPTVKMRNEVLKNVRDGRQLDYKVKDKLREIREAEAVVELAKRLKEMGVREGKKDINPWSSGWCKEQEIELEGKRKIKKIEKPEECVWIKNYCRIVIMRKETAADKEKTLSEPARERNYIKKCRKQCREIQKIMEAKRRSFILRIANRDVMPAPADHERTIIDMLLEIAMSESAYFSKEGLMAYHAQKDWFSMSEEEREAERKMLAGMSVIPKLMMAVDRNFSVRPGTDREVLINYDGTVNEEQLRLINKLYTILKGEYGYVPDEEDLTMLSKTNEIYMTYQEAKAAGKT